MKATLGIGLLLFTVIKPVHSDEIVRAEVPILNSFSIDSVDKHIPGITQSRFGVYVKSPIYSTEEEDFKNDKNWKKNSDVFSKDFEKSLKNKKLEFSKVLENDLSGFSRFWVLRLIRALQKKNIQILSPLDLMIWNCDEEAETKSTRSKVFRLGSPEVKSITRYFFLRKCTLDFSELVYEALDPVIIKSNFKKVQSGKSDFCKFESLRIWTEYPEKIGAIGYRTTHQHQSPFYPPSRCIVWGSFFRALHPEINLDEIWSKK